MYATRFKAAIAVLVITLSTSTVSMADDDARFWVEAVGGSLPSLLVAYAQELDRHPDLRARYPRSHYVIHGTGTAVINDDSYGGFCTAAFSVRRYFGDPDGRLVMRAESEVSSPVASNLRYGEGRINEQSFSAGCAEKAYFALLRRLSQ